MVLPGDASARRAYICLTARRTPAQATRKSSMFLFRWLGGWAILVAIIALVSDLTHADQPGIALTFSSLGKDWYAFSPSTLNALQAGIERHVHPALWDPLALTILKTPAFAVFGVLGVLLYAVGLRRRRTNIFAN
jgi:hypothetical protein